MARNWAGQTQFGVDSRVRKLKMPIFEGEDAYGWVYRAERYFAINGLSEREKLMAAALCLEGKALAWFQWREQRQPMRSWGEFKDRLLERFQATQEGGLHEQFFALTQERTVMEYREKFELLSGRLGGLPEAVLEGNFMKGLKLEIRASLRLLRPRGLGESMELAQMIEDKNTIERINRSSLVDFSYRNNTPLVGQKTQTLGFQREFQNTLSGGQKMQMMGLQRDSQRDRVSGARLGVTFKRLTETEIQDKRAKGVCFRCDEKFSPGHRCKDKSLQVLTVCDEEEGEEEEAAVF
uniref:Aminoacyl-tRNA ligase n=1 Tax=Citrus limon TaxID=2708 RepID=A0A1S8ADV7_CITLI